MAKHAEASPEAIGDVLNEARGGLPSTPPPARPSAPAAPKIGRNDLCPCGSGQKFKKCHGAALEEEDASDEEDQPRA